MKKATRAYKLLTEKTIDSNYMEFTQHLSRSLRAKADIIPGVHFVQPVPRGAIYWRWELLEIYLRNGNSPEHKAAVEEVLLTISATQKATA